MQFIRTAKAPELPVVLLEDTAALIGLVFALFGVVLTLVTGNGRWDGVGTLLIGLLLVVVAVVLGIEMKSPAASVSRRAARRSRRSGRRSSAARSSASSTCGRCTSAPRSCSSRPRSRSARASAADDVAAAIDEAERRVRAAVPIARVIYLEPDIRRPAADADAAGARSAPAPAAD